MYLLCPDGRIVTASFETNSKVTVFGTSLTTSTLLSASHKTKLFEKHPTFGKYLYQNRDYGAQELMQRPHTDDILQINNGLDAMMEFNTVEILYA